VPWAEQLSEKKTACYKAGLRKSIDELCEKKRPSVKEKLV
jgi:hypothetical protein